MFTNLVKVVFWWCDFKCGSNASHNYKIKFKQQMFLYYVFPF